MGQQVSGEYWSEIRSQAKVHAWEQVWDGRRKVRTIIGLVITGILTGIIAGSAELTSWLLGILVSIGAGFVLFCVYFACDLISRPAHRSLEQADEIDRINEDKQRLMDDLNDLRSPYPLRDWNVEKLVNYLVREHKAGRGRPKDNVWVLDIVREIQQKARDEAITVWGMQNDQLPYEPIHADFFSTHVFEGLEPWFQHARYKFENPDSYHTLGEAPVQINVLKEFERPSVKWIGPFRNPEFCSKQVKLHFPPKE